MTTNELEAKLGKLREKAQSLLATLSNLKELQDFKSQYLGRKGFLTEVLKGLGSLTPAERPAIGQLANRLKTELEEKISQLQQTLEAKALARRASDSALDVTLPGLALKQGRRHPLTQISKEIEGIFLNFGFSIEEGPEVESDYYNFSALNFPADHPAKEMQDTFYIGGLAAGREPLLLRTHTSPVQIRTMQKRKPPLYVIAPGAVYRHDDDVTHSPMFHQVEGLAVDEHITFGDLKGVLTLFCQTFFGRDRRVRFRPSFFPFVEPGAEVDISCALCAGRGCRVCGGDGWLEILGAGMVHPAVLKEVKIDPKKYSGFAFGMGVDRAAMLKYGIDDIRLFYESDLRFLEQF